MSSVNVKRTSSILFFLRVVKLLVSLITVSLTAKYFGVSVEKDAWLLVIALISSITLLVWGPINETFRAKFIFIKEHDGEMIALKSSSSLLCGIIIITLFLITILAVCAPLIANFSAHDLGKSGIEWFLSIFLFLLPSLLIDELNNISASILNAYNIFYIPEIVGSITSAIYIVVLLWLAPLIGIYSIVVGQYISTITLLCVLLVYIRRQHIFQIRWFLKPSFQLVKPFLYYALPFFFPYAIGQINYFTERWLATLLGVGNLSILDYSRRFTVILQTVIGSVLTTLMVPLLAKSHMSGKTSDFNLIVKQNVTVIYGIMLLAIPFLFGASYPICDFLYHRGDVTMKDIQDITQICQYYALAFLGVIIYIIFGNILLASEKGKIYAFWGVMAQLVVIIINFGFVSYSGLAIFPCSLGLVHLIVGGIMWSKGKSWSTELLKIIIRNNILIITVSFGIYLLSKHIYPLAAIPNILLCIATTLISALLLSQFIGINSWSLLKKVLQKVK